MICANDTINEHKQRRSFYRERMQPALRVQFDALLNAAREEILDLLEEIQILRQTAGDIVELYGLAVQAHQLTPNERTAGALLHCSSLLRDAVNDVVEAIAIAKKLDQRNSTDERMLSIFVGQISAVIADTCPDNIAQRLYNELQNTIEHWNQNDQSLPVLSPDKATLLMDSTIPHAN